MIRPLITPPFRTSLLTANGVPFATDNGDIQTTRDWWLYWNQLTDQGNSNSKLATAGTHGDRPSPDSMPDGALYYENDRGVLYASTLGVWQYVAGVMWGTLSPDQRPTDLGTHDAGFNFRTIVAPAREFIWSQTAWIEVTAVQYGPHSARPNPATIVQGALYVEGDRGGVIYQVESPAGTNLWQYLAGTMWGTLVPDQRPTDLGTHDAGFDFRTTVAPPREFVWNQTAWVEITPVGGAINLTHPNVVTKVDSTSGQIVEGGITDESAANSNRLHITTGGNVGIGVSDPGGIMESLGRMIASAANEPYSIGLRNNRTSTLTYIGASTAGEFQVSDAGGATRFGVSALGRIRLPNLPNASPGAGSQAIWYDPADGNRVKYTP